jgi:uncharacterized protein (TIGR02246 family)
MDDLADRVQRLEDMLAIQQLFIDYGRHLDAKDFDSYAALFAPDAELLLGPLGRAKGRDNIRSMMAKAIGGAPGDSIHLIGGPVVDLQGDSATSRVIWAAVSRDPEGRPQLGMLGHHEDELVRVDGRWYFKRRAGYVDIPSVMPRDRVAAGDGGER